MKSIKPKTYNELLAYKQCLMLYKQFPQIAEKHFEDFFNHISKKGNTLVLTESDIRFVTAGKIIKNIAFHSPTIGSNALHLSATLSLVALSYVNNPKYHSPSDGGDSGSSGNNNNNNNNNNG